MQRSSDTRNSKRNNGIDSGKEGIIFKKGKKLFIHYVNSQTTENNTPGTSVGPGSRDRTLAVKSKKIARKSPFF